jgi:hypothetical protein
VDRAEVPRFGKATDYNKERKMTNERKETTQKAIVVFEALAIVVAYFGIFAALMYPVVDAAHLVA